MYLCIISPTWGRGSDTMNCFTKKPSTIGDMGLRLAHGWIVLGIISSRSTPAVGEWRLDGRFRGFLMGCSWEFDAFTQRDFDVTPFNRISMGLQIMYCRLQCGFGRTIVEHHDLTWDSHFWFWVKRLGWNFITKVQCLVFMGQNWDRANHTVPMGKQNVDLHFWMIT